MFEFQQNRIQNDAVHNYVCIDYSFFMVLFVKSLKNSVLNTSMIAQEEQKFFPQKKLRLLLWGNVGSNVDIFKT